MAPEDSSTVDIDFGPPDGDPLEGGGGEARWWDSAEGHRFALEVLQLRARRAILKMVDDGVGSPEEIAEMLGIDGGLAAFHLAMLERALVVEAVDGVYRPTPTGRLYLERVEAPPSEGPDRS